MSEQGTPEDKKAEQETTPVPSSVKSSLDGALGVKGKGRPTLFTPERIEKLVSKVRKGLPYTTSCELCGVDYATFLRWMREGTGKPEQYPDKAIFALAIHQAGAAWEEDAVARLEGHALTDAKVDQWMLRFGPRRKNWKEELAVQKNVNVNLDGGEIDLTKLTDEQLAAMELLGLVKKVETGTNE